MKSPCLAVIAMVLIGPAYAVDFSGFSVEERCGDLHASRVVFEKLIQSIRALSPGQDPVIVVGIIFESGEEKNGGEDATVTESCVSTRDPDPDARIGLYDIENGDLTMIATVASLIKVVESHLGVDWVESGGGLQLSCLRDMTSFRNGELHIVFAKRKGYDWGEYDCDDEEEDDEEEEEWYDETKYAVAVFDISSGLVPKKMVVLETKGLFAPGFSRVYPLPDGYVMEIAPFGCGDGQCCWMAVFFDEEGLFIKRVSLDGPLFFQDGTIWGCSEEKLGRFSPKGEFTALCPVSPLGCMPFSNAMCTGMNSILIVNEPNYLYIRAFSPILSYGDDPTSSCLVVQMGLVDGSDQNRIDRRGREAALGPYYVHLKDYNFNTKQVWLDGHLYHESETFDPVAYRRWTFSIQDKNSSRPEEPVITREKWLLDLKENSMEIITEEFPYKGLFPILWREAKDTASQ